MSKYGTCILLSSLLCLSLAACSKTAGDETIKETSAASSTAAATSTATAAQSEEETSDLAGADWRTQGLVDDMGIITRDGTDTAVCICIDDASVSFYYDEAEQIFYDMAFYPLPITNARQYYNGSYFEDLNGDGNSDLVLFFLNEDGSDQILTWYWDLSDGYILEPEGSAEMGFSGNFDSDTSTQMPYFDAHDLYINAAMDNGTYLLEDGVGSFLTESEDYALGSAWWEVTKTGDYTHDGFREIEFDAICYIPEDAIPSYFDESGSPYSSVVSGELYDKYTGQWLTAASTHEDSERGENHYIHTITWKGEPYEIEFFYSTEWTESGDWDQVLTMSYIVYLPEGYDGLIFAAQSIPGSYDDCQVLLNLENICPDADLLNCDTIDPYNNLYFSID